MKHTVYLLPSGIRGIAVDGRDNPQVFKQRFWQKAIPARPEQCYYEPGKAEEQIFLRFPELGKVGWVVAKHPNPIANPNYNARITTCNGLSDNDVKTLGGNIEIQAALKILAHLAQAELRGHEVMILVHAEPSQHDARSAHLLWHILQEPITVPTTKFQLTQSWIAESKLRILSDNKFFGSVGGWVDGQINIGTDINEPLWEVVSPLSDWLSQLLELFGTKFLSTEGLRPDFSLQLRLDTTGKVRYGMFFPKLRHMGAWEFASITDGTSFSIGCTWETMHAYLSK